MSTLNHVAVCDAPTDEVIQAGEDIGLRSPWDVRWLRLSHLAQRQRQGGVFRLSRWLAYVGLASRKPLTCTCGQSLPRLVPYCVGSRPRGRVKVCRLGQCSRCNTIFWELGTTRH